ncbi:hypothetical protein C2G38_2181409 [Gigaspora rosea]|uniref:Uncharacterized protein n=1 Tax=Gigaspora rosea TaxID=44941 RepID=A0A397VC65_9GLOM|nr:hypothetical protein C2G38_2181409 [Gigaspora rosea]
MSLDDAFIGVIRLELLSAKELKNVDSSVKAKFFSPELFPQPTSDFLENLKNKPFNLSTLYAIVSLQAPNGGFPSLYRSTYLVMNHQENYSIYTNLKKLCLRN